MLNNEIQQMVEYYSDNKLIIHWLLIVHSLVYMPQIWTPSYIFLSQSILLVFPSKVPSSFAIQ